MIPHPCRATAVAAIAAILPAQAGTVTVLPTATQPALTALIAPVLTFDSARQVVVMVGWNLATMETWEFDGSDWQLRDRLAGNPGANLGGDLAYDARRSRAVMVITSGLANWPVWTAEWDGISWQVRDTASLPSGVPHLCYDPIRAETVCVTGNPLCTWTWNGANWTNRGPAPSSSVMAFDPNNGVVLASGFGWGGANWSASPGPSAPRSMTTDMVHRRVLARTPEMIEWDGAQSRFVLLQGPELPNPMVWDPVRDQLLAFAALGMSSPGITYVFRYQPDVTSSATPFGFGCPGPGGVPVLRLGPGSLRLGSPFDLELTPAPDRWLNIPIVVFGSSRTQWNGAPLPIDLAAVGAPGCMVWADPLFAAAMRWTPAAAIYDWRVPVSQNLTGLTFFAQCAVVVPGWNQAHLVTSNALQCVVGNR